MDIQDLRKALYEGVVLFEFIKKDGTLRHARGTTSPELIPQENVPLGKLTPEQRACRERTTVAFYDIDAKGWRCMRIDTLWSYRRALKLT